MISPVLLAGGLLPLLTFSEAAETVLGAYIFHRHGDRTPKSLAPTNLTALGYQQVYESGQYYRSRYLTGNSKIQGLNSDLVKLSQLSATAPVDNVLQISATGFLQGLYPPVGSDVGVQTLANGTKFQNPLDGYQVVPVNTINSGEGSEDNGWLQDASGCQNAKWSSNKYFESADYQKLLSSTKGFYQQMAPVVKDTFNDSYVNFKNAYTVYDLINVARIHNSSIPSSEVLTTDTFTQLRTLADAHEWGLAWNASDNMRAVTGMQLAGEIVKYMNNTIVSGRAGDSSNKLGIQFGAYATFLSFFGLTGLDKVNRDFTGIPDYASAMVFEMFTEKEGTSFPDTKDIKVRFLWHNGTTTPQSEPVAYPLFGQSQTALSWDDFSAGLNKFAIESTEQWCQKCGGTMTGVCAASANVSAPAPANNANGGNQHHGKKMSAAVGGVIGAMVTLAVILGTLALALLIGGLRVVPKRMLAQRRDAGEVEK